MHLDLQKVSAADLCNRADYLAALFQRNDGITPGKNGARTNSMQGFL
jgi:hypothetical protein